MLSFIEVGSRRLHVTTATASPAGAFVTQQARNLCLTLDEREEPVRFLIHDRDAKFSGSGLQLRTPAGAADREFVPDVPRAGVRRIDVLGGLICGYEPVAA